MKIVKEIFLIIVTKLCHIGKIKIQYTVYAKNNHVGQNKFENTDTHHNYYMLNVSALRVLYTEKCQDEFNYYNRK